MDKDILQPDNAGSGVLPVNIGTPPWRSEKRVMLRYSGIIDPKDIDACIARANAYAGLDKALHAEASSLIEAITKAGIMDEAGAAGARLRTCREVSADEKYVIGVAFDGDPGALTSRALMLSNPHIVLEGLLINMCIAGARHGIICVDETDAGVMYLTVRALGQMSEYGLLGANVLGTDFSADIEIRAIKPSPVLAEESALVRYLQGGQALPYLHEAAAPLIYNDAPAVVFTAETLAEVAALFREDKLPADGVTGTQIITVHDGEKKYVVEVPRGILSGALLDDIEARAGNRETVKMYRLGGIGGGFFRGNKRDMPVDFRGTAAGTAGGPGVMMIYRGDVAVPAVVKEAMDYLREQSCGQCVFCREGTMQISLILGEMLEKKADIEDIDLLEEIAGYMKIGCICRYGANAAEPVRSSLQEFRGEYEACLKNR